MISKGRKVVNSKLNEEDILLVREFYEKGWTYHELAYAFRVSRSHICNIIKRKHRFA